MRPRDADDESVGGGRYDSRTYEHRYLLWRKRVNQRKTAGTADELEKYQHTHRPTWVSQPEDGKGNGMAGCSEDRLHDQVCDTLTKEILSYV